MTKPSDVVARRTDEEAGEADEAVISPAKWKILWQSFTLTFLAEWGDRSQVCRSPFWAHTRTRLALPDSRTHKQIATIALASAKDPIGGKATPPLHLLLLLLWLTCYCSTLYLLLWQ